MIRKNSAARTFLCLLLAFVFAASCLPQTIFATTDKKTVTTWPEGPENNSGAVCLLDANTGAVLYDKNMDEQRYPASITKILTALLIIENKQMTDTVTFGEHAVSESIPGNARINVQLGETITVEDALHAILLASANEVCTQLAIDIAGSEEGFAAMMNERAAALGCTNTHFVNANGLPDPNHYTSAHDMALIMQECIKNETFCRIESDLTYTIQPTNMTSTPRDLQNHHALLFQDGQWGYKGAFAGKTGYTDEALELLKQKKKGAYNIIQIDPSYQPAPIERKQVYGITFEQGRNELDINGDLLSNIVTVNKEIPESALIDMKIALITLKYTQSNSVCYVKDGQAIGIGAGQQSRIHCTRLAGSKADNWFLRQSPQVLGLQFVDSLGRANRDNAIDVYMGDEYMDVLADGTWEGIFKVKPPVFTREEKRAWLDKMQDVTLGSDAFFPFSDNIERAHKSGVKYIAQPGGSVRDADVIACCDKYDMVMAFTGIRLFHH